MEKIKLFTHTDLDGVGCSILAIDKYDRENVDVEYCDYHNINQRVEEFYMGSGKFNYDKVYITDISVNDEVANIIESYQDTPRIPLVKLIDHHQTALELNKYDWSSVLIEDELGLASGTSLFAKELGIDVAIEISSRKTFIELVRRYDSWEWVDIYDDNKAKQLNDLLYILGRDRFIDKMLNMINHMLFFKFSDTHKLLLELEQDKIDKYVKSKNDKLTEREILGYEAGIVFAEQYHSELGSELSILNPHLDFIVMINMDSSISYRTNKEDINLGKDIASVYGGGGHPKASGSPIKDSEIDILLGELFPDIEC